ncbi:MAG: Asparagine synthase, glutamine-hydrolyzing [Myxococcales bacterium]|nr:Asparagine synthase, glutamine-hydrolyzing [Myxococcales bacterium]
MCGIYGFVAAAGDLGEPERVGQTLAAMDGSIFHRGPDDNGQYNDGRCAMGMRRLSIIDLGGGKQPISNESQRYWIVFNGEIYNYRALRQGLLARGHQFKTTSDTECIVHLFEERGEAVVDELSGMFGFAIWDRERHELLIARDRLGIKPMYYAPTPRGLVFGSELKSLICHPDVRRTISPEALSHYLSFGTTPSDQSILAGVRKLPPGHILRYRAGEMSVRRYWDLRTEERHVSEADAIAEVRSLVRGAVESHLVADVPVGAFLSGGVDSASVVGMMAELGARPKTFSIGFEEADFNELDYARIIAKKFGTDHHELVVRPDAWELTEKLVWFLDEPFADVSAIPTFLVSKLAAEHVKVVLSGDGGDEVFAGYDRYGWNAREERRFGWMPGPLRWALTQASAALPDRAPGKNFLRHIAQPAHLRYVDGESMFQQPMKQRLLGPELIRELVRRHADPMAPTDDRVALLDGAPGDLTKRLMYLDTMTYLPLDILTKVDRMTMAHSLEARPPLLDHTLVERVFGLSSSLKLTADGTQKAIFKKAVADLLPPEILSRPKRGFGVPIVKWFRGALKDPMQSVLGDKRFAERGWLDHDTVRSLVAEHLDGRRDHALPLWSLMTLELWARQFLDGAQVASTAPREVANG